jgi:hypothetical protein
MRALRFSTEENGFDLSSSGGGLLYSKNLNTLAGGFPTRGGGPSFPQDFHRVINSLTKGF